jgi:ADP-ribosylglycohydrolase
VDHEPATLTGLAIGDALGMPFETHAFHSRDLISWNGSFQSGAVNEMQSHLEPGQWTDDTMMALGLAQSLIECDTYSPAVASMKYVEWYYSGDHRGMGKATMAALERIIKGFHWVNSGMLGAEGNGSAMRAAPLGLFYRHSPATAGLMAAIDANITHRSEEARCGSAAVAVAVALLSTGRFDKSELFPRTLYHLGLETKLASKLRDAHSFYDSLPSDKAERVKASFKQVLEMGTAAHVVQTVPAAFLCFLVTDTFADAVDMAVRAGGDTDTTAAITGALAGTYYGTEQVTPYLDELEAAQRLQLCDKLLRLASPHIPSET